MGRIQSNVGLITGINIQDTVNQLMQLNAIPRDRIESKNALLQREQVAVTELTALIVGVQLTTDRLGQASLFSSATVASNNTAALTARNTGAPQPGSYSFIPVRQAQSQQLTSSLLASSSQKLSEGEVVIRTGGFLDQSVGLDQLNGGQGVARGSIRVTDRAGVSQDIDLRFAETAADVVAAINANDKLGVVAELDGDRFVLTDVSGSSTGELSVSEVGNGTTASDLGLANISTASSSASGSSVYQLSQSTALRTLLDGRGLNLPQSGDALEFQLRDGTSLQFATELKSGTASLGQFIDEINAAGEGKLLASIAGDGKSLFIKDLTSGSAAFSITSPTGDLAQQLGLDNEPVAGVITGDQLLAGLSGALLSSLNGGRGLGELGQIRITDRSGTVDTIDLSSASTLEDVIQSINDSSAGVRAQLNRSKTGIEILDTTGAATNDLIIANVGASNTATKLQIEASIADSRIDSGALNRQFVSRNTSLKDWNQGAGLTLGSIRLTDSLGGSSAINLATLQPETLGDVIDAINDLSVGVEARINDAGDGLLLVDTAGGEGQLLVEDVGSGQAAKQLGVAGTGTSLTLEGGEVTALDGSQTIRLDTTADTTIADLVDQLNGLDNPPVNASLLSVSSDSGVRLLLNSAQSGQRGRVAIEGNVGLAFSETTAARDALLAFGATENSGGVLVSSATNTFDGIIQDVEFTIAAASTSPVTVTVGENKEGVSKQVKTFVDQFNKLRDKLDELTAFDEATQSVGILFGKNSALRIDLAYGKLLSGSIRGAGSIGSLAELGVRLGDTGKLEFDQAKFDRALAADPAAVEEFFGKESTGFAARAKAVADGLAGVEFGVLLNNSNSLQSKIELNSKRIESFDIRLDKQRERLLKQFYNMETAIARLQQNQTALNQLQIIPPLGSTQ